MTLSDLKIKLIGKIEQTRDSELLEDIYRLLYPTDEESVLELSNEQKQRIEDARVQYRNGNFLSEEAADKDIEEWFGK